MRKQLLCRYFLMGALLFVCVYLNGKNTNIQYDRKQKFDFGWEFLSVDQIQDFSDKKCADYLWRRVDLPHDWSIESAPKKENPAGNDGGYYSTGIGLYRKSFTLTEHYTGKMIGLYFEGVYMNAQVTINGHSVTGEHPYGYTSFYVDITPYVHIGKSNTVIVQVDNSHQKNCRWYSGSGIYRHVWLIVTPKIYIEHHGIYAKTKNVTNKEAIVEVTATISNKTTTSQTINVNSWLSENNTRKTGKQCSQITLLSGETKELTQEIRVKGIKLWSTEHPYLYNVNVSVSNKNKLIDLNSVTFGIRTITCSVENGLKINGEKILLNGGCVHHDNGCLGATAYDRAEIRKVELLKEAGFNAVRTSHNPPSEAFLDACDRIGLLVIDEIFDGWRANKTSYDYAILFDLWHLKDLEAMVLRDRNHPSVFCWSIGNEIIERKKTEAVETAKMLVEKVKLLDNTRPVTSAMTTWDRDWNIFDPLFSVHDIGGYNYQLHRAKSDHLRVPERIMMQTESYPREAFKNWVIVNDNEYVVGDFVWTAIDYLGESGIGRYYYQGETEGEHYHRDQYPWHGAYCGDIDLTGWRKPISYYRDILYNQHQKRIYLAVKEPNGYYGTIKETLWSVWPTWDNWTWPGHEGKNIEVEVYSNYPAVRLYLNDQFIGEKETTREQEFKAIFSIPYEAGELRAIGVENGKEKEICVLKTACDVVSIRLTPDCHTIHADGQELIYVTTELVDKNGVCNPNRSFLLNFESEGEGTIIATASADMKDNTPYISAHRKTWKGRALAVIKNNGNKGIVKLKVSAEGLPVAEIIMQVK